MGCENFLANHLDLVKGKRLGLITNPTGVDSHLNNLIDLFHENPGIDLVALYGPEHGVRGNAQAGENVPFCRDEKYDLPVFSLYGQSMEHDTGMLRDMDEHMRSFDAVETGKVPKDSMIENVDVMVFDIQDIGTRVYTYISTLAYCMEVCAKNGIEFIVLDRPNPINGVIMEGPLLEYPEFSSFVGLFPIPIRHAMTIGELAQLFNERFCTKRARLTVIPMKGWKRSMWYDQTFLPGARRTTAWVEEMVFYIVNHRYNNKKLTVFTSNYPDHSDDEEDFRVEHFKKGEKSEENLVSRIGVRLRSRLYEMCKIVRMEGDDYRQKIKQAGYRF